MGVYRGDKPKDKQAPAKSTGQTQPQLRQRDSELAGLNDHRRRHGRDPLIEPSSPGGYYSPQTEEDSPEHETGPAEDPRSGVESTAGRVGSFYHNSGEKGLRISQAAKSQAGKRAALVASGFFGPIIIAVALLVFALEAGLPTEQISQAIIGQRFARIHGAMARRLGHLSASHQLWAVDPDIARISDLQKVNRPSLLGRLTGISNEKAYRNLQDQGYRIKYERRRFGIRRLISEIYDPKGRLVYDRSQGTKTQRVGWLKSIARAANPDTFRGRLLARRSVFLLARLAGLRLTSFRSAMSNIRTTIRGPPQPVSQAVSSDIMATKTRLRHRVLGTLGIKLGTMTIGEGPLQEVGDKWSDPPDQNAKKSDHRKLVQNTISDAKKSAGVKLGIKIVRTASAGILLATAFCTAHVIVRIVREIAELKILQEMDTAASLLTFNSQRRAGDVDYALVNELNSRFDGFGNAITYQALYDTNSVNEGELKRRLPEALAYVNQRFNIKYVFGGLFKGLNSFVRFVVDNFIPDAGFPDWVPLVGGWNFRDWALGYCDTVLTPGFQIGAGVLLAMGEAAVTYFAALPSVGTIPAGFAAAKAFGWGLFQAIALAVVVGKVAETTDFDEALTNHLMPDMIEIATGIQSAIDDTPTDPNDPNAAAGHLVASLGSNGAENYLKVDYGASHVSDAQALGEGGGLIDREVAVAQDKFYLAQQRQQYSQQGVWANIMNPRNPYSFVARLQSRLPYQPLRTQPDQIRSAASWLIHPPTEWLGSTQADEVSDRELSELFYPDWGTEVKISKDGGEVVEEKESAGAQVIGFTEAEVTGLDEAGKPGMFDFVKNTAWVEAEAKDKNGEVVYRNGEVVYNLDQLREEYAGCLTIEIGKFRLHQAGITDLNGDDYYPSECSELEARRYLIYYQDCQHIVGMDRIDSDTSPMLATDCDNLLPDSAKDVLATGSPSHQLAGADQAGAGMFQALARAYHQPPVAAPATSQPFAPTPLLALQPKAPWEVRRWNLA